MQQGDERVCFRADSTIIVVLCVDEERKIGDVDEYTVLLVVQKYRRAVRSHAERNHF